MAEQEIDELNKEIAKLKKENEDLKNVAKSKSEKEYLFSKRENEYFIDELLSSNKLRPGSQDAALEILNYATEYDLGILQFSEGKSLRQKVKDFLNSIPAIELTMQTEKIGGVAHFNKLTKERRGYGILDGEIETPEELDQRIQRCMQLHNISYKEAFQKIIGEENNE